MIARADICEDCYMPHGQNILKGTDLDGHFFCCFEAASTADNGLYLATAWNIDKATKRIRTATNNPKQFLFISFS